MSQKSTGTMKEKPVMLRKGSHSKIPLKEKIVQIYEAFFRGEDPSRGNANFWDELFLLKVNGVYLEAEFDKLNGDQLMALKEIINNLFYKCVETLNDNHQIRMVNAMQTICALIKGVFKKSFGDYGFDVINILIGFDNAESQMQTLLDRLNQVLVGDFLVTTKNLALRVLLVLVTVTDNVSQNTLLEYVMINSVFESVIQILASPVLRQEHGHDAALLLTVLVQYRKYESANPYVVKLSILDDELALTGYAQIISLILSEHNRHYKVCHQETQQGFFSSLTSMVGNMFVTEEKTGDEQTKGNDTILLALYEAIHLNRNFITTLTHTHTHSSPVTPPSSPTTPSPTTDPVDPLANVPLDTNEPTNLLVTFLVYCSIIMQNIKNPARYHDVKLCFIILTCITEDQYANSLMHDQNINFRVHLHKMPMRHRKHIKDPKAPSRPLSGALLDLMVEFVMSHMMKNFPMELYCRCLGIVHRVLCYQKKCRVRMQYPWKELWTALINLLKFIMASESTLLKNHDIFYLCSMIVNVFNLFITYGDTFLPNPHSYDELYYEIVRMHQVFDNLYSMALRYATTEGKWKESSIGLTNSLLNIRGIINHFTPKVDSWAANNQLSSLTEEQVLEVVRGNYDSLTLKLQDNLDQYERYSEKPAETAFFTNYVRHIIQEVRQNVGDMSDLKTQMMLQTFVPQS